MGDIKRPKIGAHVSSSGGLHNAIINAKNIGAECIQIFGSSPRQWAVKMPEKIEVERFKKEMMESGIDPVYLHAAYLVNLASPSADILKKSIQSLIGHLKIASIIEADGLIFHIGSGKGMPKKKALEEEVKAMKEVLQSVPGKTELIMENTAGGGDKLGSIEDIAYLYNKVKSNRVKICYDTAHGFESGLIEKYDKDNIKKLFDEWEAAIGVENIVVIHANDSKTAYNSKHDRHENVGDGCIKKEGFNELAREKRINNKAWILEVPGSLGDGVDKKNVNILKSCFNYR